jgi:predicted nucleotide-binding protein (sugar kinase/HSP70/actin superfamily)
MNKAVQTIFQRLVLSLGVFALSVCPAVAAEQGDGKLPPRDREIKRISEVMEWARKTNASETETTKRILGPIIVGNQKDAERNGKMAEQFRELAAQAKKDRQEAVAKKYMTVAALFKECANENQRFLKGLQQGDASTVKDSLKRLRAYDDRIEEITGKRIERSWYMLEEMADTIKSLQRGVDGNSAPAEADK